MPTSHSGFLIQSDQGGLGNFELVTSSRLGGLAHCWRNNDDAALPWHGPAFFGSGEVLGLSLIQSTFGPPGYGHLEVVARVDDRLAIYWRTHHPPLAWSAPSFFAAGVTGNPALIQSRFGAAGNFELVVPLASGGLAHYWRNNDDPNLPWIGPTVFGASLGQVAAVSFIQSTFGDPGHLEVIARVGSDLLHWWRDSGPSATWHGPRPIPVGSLPAGAIPIGVPAFIQSRFGTQGNFELVSPLSTGGLAHWWRDNDDPLLPWSPPTVFGQGAVSAAALIQSTFGTPGLGSLELAVRIDGRVEHYWRSDQPPFPWSGPTALVFDEPSGNPPVAGEWRIPFSSSVVGVHATLLHTGNVAFFSYAEAGHDHGEPQAHGAACVTDPVTGISVDRHPDKNLFCAGQTVLPDGRLFVAGGNLTGVGSVHTFTPVGDGGFWQEVALMADDRWYPTTTVLPDGRVLILSGSREGGGPAINPHTCTLEKPVNATAEIWDPVSDSLEPPVLVPLLNAVAPYALYPLVFLLPTGKLLVHGGNHTFFLDLATWTPDAVFLPTVNPMARTYPAQGTAVLLPLLPTTAPPYQARVLLIGGAGASCPTPADPTTPATSTCELLDLAAEPLAWQPAPSLLTPRVMPDAVLLPDGTVLVMNGSSTGVADNGISPVLEVELYDAVANAWTALQPMRVPRLYHSTALLLPDGRVLTAGKDEEFNPDPFRYPEYRIEIFSPPYLFREPRPVILAAPEDIAYGTPFQVTTADAAWVNAAVLLRPGAVTHSFNMSQRSVELLITGRSVDQLTVQGPPSGTVAPPGYYMLFLVSSEIPSEARFVRLH
ncbi:MAG TPA: galactose oxidase-like domain-containing protein [Dehalococcoidia bacterium]|nr:galactose oxidase-like domain-containing protein [Dehalococcoidia bacterium]